MSGYVLDWLRLGRVDLGLLDAVVEDRNLRSISLLSEELLVLPSPGHGLRDLLDETAAAQGVRLVPDIQIDAYAAIKVIVERGLGLSVLPAHAIGREVDEGRMQARRFDPPLVRIVHPPTDRPLSTAARAIEGLCRTTLAELVRSGTWRSAQMRVST